jgi:AraC-like DNA-binding protein
MSKKMAMLSGIPSKSKIGTLELLKISPFKEVIKPTVPHKHAGYFELIFLSDGAGTHLIDEHIYEVAPPTIFFLKPGQTHCWDFTRIPKGYVLLFKEELLTADLLAIVYGLPTVIEIGIDHTLLPLLTLLHQEFQQQGTNMKVLTGYLHLIVQKTSILGLQIPRPQGSALFYQFKSLLNSTEQGLKNVQEFAEILQVSTHQLNAVCRDAGGKTPLMMINERLLLEAKTLLSATALSIKEISHILHFGDTSHFVKFFKAATNLTPGNYRKLLSAKQ